MSNALWNGVFPAVTTKFTADDRLDITEMERCFALQRDAGVDGIIVCGSLGEASTLDPEEKIEVLKTALRVANGKIPVLMTVVDGATRRAQAQAEAAAKAGAHGLMVLPGVPYKSEAHETMAHFRAVAKAGGLPVMIYNNPVDYKIDVTLDMFAELAALPNINAIKESTRDVTNITRLRNRFGTRFAILCGVDPLTVEELALGADGLVAGLVDAFPKETVVMYNLVKAGRMEEAIAIYRWFMPLLELDIHPKLVQYIKLAAVETGIGTEHVRAPRLPLIGEERERVLKVIRDGIATRPKL